MNEFRVGIIGLGECGEAHRDAWQSLGPRVKVQAICDESLGVRMRAAQAGFTVYSDCLEMLEQEKLDAVSICTPPSSHPELAELCMRRGIAALCEKPLATDVNSVFRLYDTARATGAPFALAAKFRQVPEVEQAREWIAAGEIGEVLTYRIEFADDIDMSARWNSLAEVAGGGVIMDNGCHAFDLVRFLIGPIHRVLALRLKQSQDLEVEDSAMIVTSAGTNILGEVLLSWSLSTGSPNYATICGSEGTIELGWEKSVIRRTDQEPEVFGGAYSASLAHRRMVEAFLDTVQSEAPLWITAAEAIETALAVEAAYRSLDGNASIEIAHAQR